MAKHTYRLNISVDAGAVVRPFGEVIDEVNKHMADFGFHEKLGVRSTCISTTITTVKELTKEELNTAKALIMDAFNEKHPEWLARIENTVVEVEV